jgi:transposase
MCQAAWAASRTKDTYLSTFYRRMSIRKGTPKAVMALAHHLIVVAYQVLRRGEEYVEFGGGYHVDLRQIESGATKAPEAVAYTVTEPKAVIPAEPPAMRIKRRPGRPCKRAERGII